MTDFYKNEAKFYVGVDCIIFSLINGKLSVLMVKRRFDPGMGRWSLMGGFVGADESVDEAARRVLRDLTGISDLYMEQVGAFGEINRDPGERVVSVAYYALVGFGEFNPSRIARLGAEWFPLDQMPEMLFDHRQMLDKARDMLRQQMSREPIGFKLLPHHFTLTQLQNLYETITGEPADKRNFRKRVCEVEAIEKTDLIDKTGSRRGAALYRFNEKVYNTNRKFKL